MNVKKLKSLPQFATFHVVLLSLRTLNHHNMKKIFTILACFALSSTVVAQKSTNKVNEKTQIAAATPAAAVAASSVAPKENLVLMEEEHDFGKIPQGKPVTHDFVIKNTGSTPLVLDNVRASCGCTTPEWSKEPIAPGKTAVIKVGYNAANEGAFSKPVTITYNGNMVKQLIIKGEVWKTPVTSAPVNNSLSNLKQ